MLLEKPWCFAPDVSEVTEALHSANALWPIIKVSDGVMLSSADGGHIREQERGVTTIVSQYYISGMTDRYILKIYN